MSEILGQTIVDCNKIVIVCGIIGIIRTFKIKSNTDDFNNEHDKEKKRKKANPIVWQLL